MIHSDKNVDYSMGTGIELHAPVFMVLEKDFIIVFAKYLFDHLFYVLINHS